MDGNYYQVRELFSGFHTNDLALGEVDRAWETWFFKVPWWFHEQLGLKITALYQSCCSVAEKVRRREVRSRQVQVLGAELFYFSHEVLSLIVLKIWHHYLENSYIDKYCRSVPYFWHLFPLSIIYSLIMALVINSQLGFTISNDEYSRVKQCGLISLRIRLVGCFFNYPFSDPTL